MRRVRGIDEPEIELIAEPLGSTAPPATQSPPAATVPLDLLLRGAIAAVAVISLCFVVMAWSFFSSAKAQQRQACIAGAQASVQTFYFGNTTDAEARRAQSFVHEQMRRCGVTIIDISSTTTTRSTN
jgi:hypothetical protein